MRTLTIAGLVMVTAITATPAAAQRQGWHNGQITPSTVSINPPSVNRAPGVTWNRPGAPIATPPQSNAPRLNTPGPRTWSNRQLPAGVEPRGGRPGPMSGTYPPGAQTRPDHVGGHSPGPLPGYNPVQPGQRQHRWGGSVGGRWYGGSNAPGGWKAYRRPVRGWTLPRYWIAPSFFIGDYGLYGLSSPPYGYNWTRYYDDAVLTDSRGRVYDSVSGIDWDSYDDGYGYGDADYRYGEDYDYRTAGGSAEVGAGYGYGSTYGGGYGASYAPPPPQYVPGPPPQMVQNGYTQTWSSGGGYASGGYWYPPVTTTTVTVQSAPVVTTTTTEYVETSYRSARRVYKAPKRTWRPKSKVRCLCN